MKYLSTVTGRHWAQFMSLYILLVCNCLSVLSLTGCLYLINMGNKTTPSVNFPQIKWTFRIPLVVDGEVSERSLEKILFWFMCIIYHWVLYCKWLRQFCLFSDNDTEWRIFEFVRERERRWGANISRWQLKLSCHLFLSFSSVIANAFIPAL